MSTNKTWKITSNLEVNYEIIFSEKIFEKDNPEILKYGNNGSKIKRLLIIDKNVSDLYLGKIESYFNLNDVKTKILIVNGGEEEKNTDNLFKILETIEQFGISRKNEPLIGIGGGVILDLVGFACSIYRRGIPYIRVPTTLLGIVDVSVAAKTGINYLSRRNRLGSYFPPLSNILDTSFLKSLEEIELISGLGEILKMAVIKDKDLFELIENYGDKLLINKFQSEPAHEVILKSVEGMKTSLENNLWENNLKRDVDFGHSFSPIIEMRSLTNPRLFLTHGQAVSLDVLFSSCIAFKRNLLTYEELDRVFKTARKLKLPTRHESFEDKLLLWESLNDTVKHRNGDQNLPIPDGIGSCVFLNDFSYSEIDGVIELFKDLGK
jgi:2-epi-5-epi-valiolone synthase